MRKGRAVNPRRSFLGCNIAYCIVNFGCAYAPSSRRTTEESSSLREAPRAWRRERGAEAASIAEKKKKKEERKIMREVRKVVKREKKEERQEKRREGAEVFPRGDQATVVPASNTRSPKGRVKAPKGWPPDSVKFVSRPTGRICLTASRPNSFRGSPADNCFAVSRPKKLVDLF